MRRYWLLWLAAAALLAACNLVAVSEGPLPVEGQAGVEPTLSGEFVPQIPTDVGTAVMYKKTYSNVIVGYEFDYPPDWYLLADDPFFVQVSSVDPATLRDGMRSGAVVLSFATNDAAETVEQAARALRESLEAEGVVVTSESPVELRGGIRGLELLTADGARTIIASLDGQLVQIDGIGEPLPIEAVLETLREV